jgi:hypothetical protein
MNWSRFNFWNFWAIMFAFIVGTIMGIIFPRGSNKPSKNYPIEVRCYWNHGSYADYPIIQCDSIKGDTLWKDGLMIINKNIINIEFK